MTTATIKNISFTLSDSIEFSFQHGDGQWDNAHLQLPDTSDCIHSISGEDFDCDNETHTAIYNHLEDEYFNSFKDTECAAASALLQKEVLHVEEVDGFYVAFSENDTDVIIESRVRSYYNKRALFDYLDQRMEEQPDVESLIKKATKAYFDSLTRALKNELAKEVESAKASDGDNLSIWNQGFDDCVHQFMMGEFNQFGLDYNNYDLAQEFYQMHACDCRSDAENELREHFEG